MKLITSLTCLIAVLDLTSGTPWSTANVKRQASQLLDSYDFVISGAGTCGLTVADRLTEAFPDSLSSFTFFPILLPQERDFLTVVLLA